MNHYQALAPIDQRVQRSLERIGLFHIEVADEGDGKIRLSGQVETKSDIVVACRTAQIVIGVKEVDHALTARSLR